LVARALRAATVFDVRVNDAAYAWGPFALVLLFACRSLPSRLMSSWIGRRRLEEEKRFDEEARIHDRVPRVLQERVARLLGYSKVAVNWALEPVDWREYPLPQGSLEGLYHPEHVATSMRELVAARSPRAAQEAARRLENAIGQPGLFIVYPVALPASRRLLDILLDPVALPLARWAAGRVLVTLLDEPHPDIHFASPDDDTHARVYEGIVTAVRERATELRELSGREQGPGALDEQSRDTVRQVLRMAGER
jgi:hypothetical protein